MANDVPLRQRLIDQFDQMTPRLQQAARHLIDHPQDIALLSMRELARNAGVQPATMTRLAQFLGASGFEPLRDEQIASIRQGGTGLVARAAFGRRLPDTGPMAVADETLATLSGLLATLSNADTVAQLVAGAAWLQQARRIYVQGNRSCHAVAWQFHYVMSALGRDVVLLEGLAGTGSDALTRASHQDVLLVISVNPYARHSLQVAEHAASRGLVVVAMTDSEVSPLARHARQQIICPVDGAGMFHSLVPLMAASEVLCSLLAAQDPDAAFEALSRLDAQLAALNTYVSPTPPRGPRRKG